MRRETGGEWIHVCMAESQRCSSETTTTLLIGYMSIQNEKLKKKSCREESSDCVFSNYQLQWPQRWDSKLSWHREGTQTGVEELDGWRDESLVSTCTVDQGKWMGRGTHTLELYPSFGGLSQSQHLDFHLVHPMLRGEFPAKNLFMRKKSATKSASPAFPLIAL